jgi:hypothetical protein
MRITYQRGFLTLECGLLPGIVVYPVEEHAWSCEVEALMMAPLDRGEADQDSIFFSGIEHRHHKWDRSCEATHHAVKLPCPALSMVLTQPPQ